ncbi:arabinofuranosidase catalytic domain-containing protein [Sphingomonas qomolangmaensis]|uniref:NEW3 domain-containing protein n=1 Tax=Sphingomonas qomolangmaensis TaxID=2918765 RepID=A0ABY5L6Y3_9SPHN|nr:arabinofuranosidase catalytic domain-containing protein [Sphingomonas qomolangmaensis]UUL81495.1 NEW3 domain-containing protein [Sphingomonas qomolangmaensis]
MLETSALAIALALASSGPATTAPARPVADLPQGPCDLYNAAGTPCVSAHSTTRVLLSRYAGPLYQVMRRSDDTLLDIGVLPDGYADAAAQDRFCAGTLCVITKLYDQSGKGNDLYQAPPGPKYPGPANGAFNALPIADMAPITIGGGRKAYGVYVMPGMGFRNNKARDLPIDDEAGGIHVVVAGDHYSNGCCFNYGNASTNGLAVGTGTMESVYFGTSSGWGSGSGKGPWIMSDMEAGLFSGYDAGVNAANPSIDWRFVTGVFGGGGRNFWKLRGGDAQRGALSTFYEGVRPGSRENKDYFPMRKKGAIQMGNGGDNGNGSAGTFYEGVMTAGHPSDAVTDAVQANVVAARYDLQRLTQTRLTSFRPGGGATLTATFRNTAAEPAADVALGVALPSGWTARPTTPASFARVAPGASVQTTFEITSPATSSAGFLTAKADWRGAAGRQADTSLQRVRSAQPVKLNEVRFATGGNATNQFVELYNASDRAVDISNWQLTNTRTFFASEPLATIPAGTRLAAGKHYLLGLAPSGLVAPAAAGARSINVRSTEGFATGQQIAIAGETRRIASVGTAATVPTTIFIPVSTGPWLTVPAGSTTLPVADATGFAVGDKMSIDAGGNPEVVTVTRVGTAATQTTLAVAVKQGATTLKLADVSNLSVGDTLSLSTGQRLEWVKVAAIGSPGADGTGVTLTAPLKFDNMEGVDVAGPGTGIGFSPATRHAHKSGDAVQALGSGIALDRPLGRAHPRGAPIANPQVQTAGYRGPAPQQWFGGDLSIRGGAISLTDPSGKILVDAIVYGSQQSNSSASGAVTMPEIATLEGDQHQGGCIAVIPGAGSGPSAPATALAASAPGAPDRSVGRFPDGADTDSLCNDFVVQPATTAPQGAAAGAKAIGVASVAGFVPGQAITIGAEGAQEAGVIANVGTSGATVVRTAVEQGGTAIDIADGAGFGAGQAITISQGADAEEAVVKARQNGRDGSRITLTAPLARAYAVGTRVSGSGITLRTPLQRAHAAGAAVRAELPTPGAANAYTREGPGTARR